MNILQINKFFYLHGGANRYFFNVSPLLEKHNHQVAFFSMHHSKNKPTEWSKYFVSSISFHDKSMPNLIKILSRMFYSVEARRKISQLLDDFKPDIVHIHSIYHHLSPSILIEIKRRNIPIVMTVHDYHLIAPNYNLFHNGKICEITKLNKFYKAFFHKCVKNSHSASLLEVFEKYIHSYLGWDSKFIDSFIAPSKFMRKKLIEYGVNKKKIVFLPHFIDCKNYTANYTDSCYILYFGRFSEEKGLAFLIEVVKKLSAIRLKIVGRGPLEDKLKRKIQKEQVSNIELIGFKEKKELRSLIIGSRFTILPSLWYENFPNSILESFASGKPCVGSNIGGIPELINDGYNGFLFEPGNIEVCKEKIARLWSNPPLCRRLGKNARRYVEENFGAKDHYKRLMETYNTVSAD